MALITPTKFQLLSLTAAKVELSAGVEQPFHVVGEESPKAVLCSKRERLTSVLTFSTYLDLILPPYPFLDFTKVPSLLQNRHSAVFACEHYITQSSGQKARTHDNQGEEQQRCRAMRGYHLEAVSWLNYPSISSVPDRAGGCI